MWKRDEQSKNENAHFFIRITLNKRTVHALHIIPSLTQARQIHSKPGQIRGNLSGSNKTTPRWMSLFVHFLISQIEAFAHFNDVTIIFSKNQMKRNVFILFSKRCLNHEKKDRKNTADWRAIQIAVT